MDWCGELGAAEIIPRSWAERKALGVVIDGKYYGITEYVEE